jgi:hypothetical protein
MKNPYEEWDAHPEDVRVGRAWAWVFSVLFLAIIVLPPAFRNLHNTICPRNSEADEKWAPVMEFFHYPNPKSVASLAEKKRNNPGITREQPNLQDHLRSFEAELEAAPYATAIRQWMQQRLTAGFREGNSKTVIGKEGRMYYQAGIDCLVGYGPLKPEPDSVMKNPDRAIWTPPIPVITKFAAQLKERGIELMIVPVPVKSMIYPEDIGRGDWEKPVHHRDQEALYKKLRDAGIELVDLSDLFWTMKKTDEVFLRQDTHWSQLAMQKAAAAVADKIKSKPWFDLEKADLQTLQTQAERQHMGDLVEMLNLAEPKDLFQVEAQQLTMIRAADKGGELSGSRQSPIVLLGDSFVNIYNDPGIGFGETDGKPPSENKSESPIGAGFAQHLALALQTPLDVYTANGGGATQVRKDFADQPDNEVRAKKIVVWVLASRDLLLSETPGVRAGIRWGDVEFSKRIAETPTQPVTSDVTEVVVEAELKERTPLQDPKSTPYKEAIYSAIFTVDEKAANELKIEGNEIPAYLWGFRDRKVVASGRLEVGKKYRLTLVPWASKTNLQSVQKMDDLLVLSDWWFVEKVEPIEGGR